MKRAILFMFLCLTACQPIDWQMSPRTHTCSIEQMGKVETETRFCVASTDYASSYCYGAAILRNCDKLP